MTDMYGRFAVSVSRFADRTAIEVQRRDGVESHTFRQLQQMADGWAMRLSAAGIGAGDRCAILAENDAQWVAAYLGIQRLAAVAVPLDTNYRADQVAKLLIDSGSSGIVTTPNWRETVDEARAQLSVDCPVLMAGDLEKIEPGDIPPPTVAAPEDPGVILYTSGTTSDPKGVVLTQANLLAEIDAAVGVVNLNDTDVVLGVLPLFHALALMANLTLPLTVGSRVVFLETLNTTELLRALEQREITTFVCVPQFFYLIHERVMEQVDNAGRLRRLMFRRMLRLSGVLRERFDINIGPRLFGRVHRVLGPRMRLLVTGGSRFDPRIGRDMFHLGFNILQAYGLTETSGGATVLRPGDKHVESVGQGLPGVEIKIVPSELTAAATDSSDGRPTGEVLIRGAIVMPGYYKRSDANAETLKDGWLHTGDIGYLDDEQRLYITGRAKDVIVLSNGKNIYPEEIEAHYLQSPFLKEMCVMGLSRDAEPSAERLHGVIVPDFDLLRRRKILNSREIVRWEIEGLSAGLPSQKRILSYDIASDDLPRTTTRKLKRFEIQRRYRDGAGATAEAARKETTELSADDLAWMADEHVARALDVIRGAAREPERIAPGSNLELDLGLDSMERVELLASLSVRFGVTVSDELSSGIYTVRELVEAVRMTDGASAVVGDADDAWAHLLDEQTLDDSIAESLERRPLASLIIFLLAKLVYGVAWLFMGFRVSGRENLPSRGPFMLCPNHQSFLDGFLIASALPYRTVRDLFFVGAMEYFESRVTAWFARKIHLIPIDPDTHLVRAMQAGAYGLRNDRVLILFPEGERTIDGEVKQFKKGAAILALHLGVPIVPVAFDGAFELWPRGRGLQWSKLLPLSGTRMRIHFGEPLAAENKAEHRETDYGALTRELRTTVAELQRTLSGAEGPA